MKKIVILGSSAAGAKAIEEIRRSDSESEITIIAFDGHYPYKRDAFAPFIAKEIAGEDVFARAKDFYEQHNVSVILDKKISRINVKRKKIFTEDKEQIDYDVLLITDSPENRFPDIKGTNKAGVFGYKKLKDIDQISNMLPLIDTVIIQSDSFSGLQAAAAMASRGKEVIFISSEKDFLGKHFETATLQWLTSRFDEHGLRIMRASSIAEILGDKDAKAVRLKSGKVYAAQVILFGEIHEDFRLFSDSGLILDKKIDVNCQFQTNIDSIFAIDQVCVSKDLDWLSRGDDWIASEPVTPFSVLEGQGRVVAAAINGQEQSPDIPVLSWEITMKGLSITVFGKTEVTEKITVRRTFDDESGTYKGLYVEDNCLVGAVLINAESERDEYLKLITERAQVGPAEDEKLTDESSVDAYKLEEGNKGDISTELVDK